MTVVVTCEWSIGIVGCQSTAGEKTGGWLSSATAPAVNVAKNLWIGSRDGLKRDALAYGNKFSAEGRKEVDATKRLFDNGEYAVAVKRYKKAAENYKGTSAGEEAQFRLAECWYALKRYPRAQDGYDQLFADYPSTRFVQPATKRLYEIAQNWLDLSDPAHRSTIRTVSAVEV